MVIVVSHDISLASKYGDGVIELKEGRLNYIIENTNNKPYITNKCNKSMKSKNVLKLSKSLLFKHKISLTMSIVTMILSMLILYFCIVIARFDISKTFYDNGLKYNQDVLTLESAALGDTQIGHGMDDMLEKIGKYTDYVINYSFDEKKYNYTYLTNYTIKYNNISDFTRYKYNNAYEIKGIIEYDDKSQNILGLSIREGKEPTKNDEAMISYYMYDYFRKYGYKGSKNGENIEFYPSETKDIIGIELYGYIITGVINTREDYTKYNFDLDTLPLNVEEWNNYHDDDENGLICSLYVKKGTAYQMLEPEFDTDLTKSASDADTYEIIEDLPEDKYNIVKKNEDLNIVVPIDYVCKLAYEKKILPYSSFSRNVKYIKSNDKENLTDKEICDMIANKLKESISDYGKTYLYFTRQHMFHYRTYYGTIDGFYYSYDYENSNYHYIDKCHMLISKSLEESYKDAWHSNVTRVYTSFKSSKELIKGIVDRKFTVKSEINFNHDENLVIETNYLYDEIFSVRYMLSFISKIFMFISLALIVISALLITKNINSNMQYRIKDIGILRSMGIKKLDLYRIFNIYNILMFLVTLIISIPISTSLINVLNKELFKTLLDEPGNVYVKLLIDSPINSLICISFCIIIPLIVTLLPILKQTKKSINTIIKDDRL